MCSHHNVKKFIRNELSKSEFHIFKFVGVGNFTPLSSLFYSVHSLANAKKNIPILMDKTRELLLSGEEHSQEKILNKFEGTPCKKIFADSYLFERYLDIFREQHSQIRFLTCAYKPEILWYYTQKTIFTITNPIYPKEQCFGYNDDIEMNLVHVTVNCINEMSINENMPPCNNIQAQLLVQDFATNGSINNCLYFDCYNGKLYRLVCSSTEKKILLRERVFKKFNI